MRNSIYRTAKKDGGMPTSVNRRASTIRWRIARKALGMVIAALLVSSSLTDRARAADGDLDLTFDGDGRVTTDFFGSGEGVEAIAVQSDGRIVAAGSTSLSPGQVALARYNPDGSLDQTFGTGGKVTTDFSGATAVALAVAIQANGRIVVAGFVDQHGGPVNQNDFALARYNLNGSLDTSFGVGGKVTTDIGSNDSLLDLAIQTDGKIVAAGHTSSAGTFDDFAILRYNANGSLDPGFGADGVVITDFTGMGDIATSVVIQGNGRIVAAGHTNRVSSFQFSDFALVRYNADGSLDPTFGAGGKVATDFSNRSDDDPADLVLQPDGRLVAAGGSNVNSANPNQYHFALARYDPDGTLDLTFGESGRVITDFLDANDFALGVAIQSDGRIVAGGASQATTDFDTNDFAVARYNPDGSLDLTFGTDGKVRTDFLGQADRVSDIAIQADGRIVAAGRVDTDPGSGDQSDFALARYQSNAASAIVYDICLQDDDTGDILKFNSRTGDYLIISCGAQGFTLRGRGAVIRLGCNVSLTGVSLTHTVSAIVDTCQAEGTSQVLIYALGRSFRITDSDTSNSSCTCR